MWCPQTCGCDSITSDLVLWDSGDGCPSSCQSRPSYRAPLENRSCAQLPKHDLITSNEWRSFANNLKIATQLWPDSKDSFAKMSDDMLQEGCDGLLFRDEHYNQSWQPLCPRNNEDIVREIKTLHFLCPLTCRCPSSVEGA